MSTTKPNDWTRIAHPDGSITVVNQHGYVIGWTEHGSLGWSALWRTPGGDERRFADSAEGAAMALRTALAEEH